MTRSEPLHTVTVVPGDGVGPEVVRAAQRVLDASGASIAWDVQEAGAAAFEREGTPLPDRVVESVRRNQVALKGPLATSADAGYGSPNVALREQLDLHTTVRPCRSLPGLRTPHRDVDLVVVKMNHEDLYARLGYRRGEAQTGAMRDVVRDTLGHELPADSGVSIKPLSASAARRVLVEAFEYATAHRRSRVTAVHKASLMPDTDGLFLEVARGVAAAYPEVAFDDALVDTVCERLVSRPGGYDVLAMQRMYGDIVSGLGAALIGGPGVAPGVNLGDDCSVFEATHGSAPRLAGSGRANPIALIRTGAMLLRRLGEADAAQRVEAAVAAVTGAGSALTYDLEPDGAPAGTDEVADAVVAALT